MARRMGRAEGILVIRDVAWCFSLSFCSSELVWFSSRFGSDVDESRCKGRLEKCPEKGLDQ
jgi:hypothetical protein